MRAALLCLVFVVGCKERNPHYCPGTDNNLCEPDAQQTLCETSMQCPTASPVCKMPDGVCVQCTTAEDDACAGSTPVCNVASNTCIGCKEHSECAATSGVCMPDGSCAATSDVAYVAPGTSGDCSKTSPCGSLVAAVMTPKPIIKIAAGMITGDTNQIPIERTVTIIGEGEQGTNVSEVRRSTGSTLLVRNNADVKMYRLKIAAGTGGNAIDLQPNGGSPKLLLERVVVGSSDGYGLFSTGGSLTITRSTFFENRDGALSLTNTSFKIVNNMIRNNGLTDAPGSAVEISGSTATDVFEFNTVAGNLTSDGLATAMDCSGMVVVRNNIIYANTELSPATIKHADGNCSYTNNIIGEAGTAPVNYTNNMDINPMFVSTSPANFHVMPASPARNLASGGAPNALDFDGEPRPNPAGMPADVGADEIP